jgi:hypothetical protein
MAKRHIFNRRMQHILRLSDEHTPLIKTIQKNSLAATRCRLDMPFDTVTNPSPRDDAYMIVIQIHGKNSRELWLDGRPIKTEPLHAGGVDVDARLASTVEKIKVNEAGSIGVIAEDESACYTGTLIKNKTETGMQKVLVVLQANTVIRTKAIIVRRQAVYQNPDTIKAVLPKFKSDVAAFVAANP